LYPSWTLTERALRAVGQRRQQIGGFGGAMLPHEPLDIVSPAPPARFAVDHERRLANVGQRQRAMDRLPG
jgi:hypothetical protein